MYLIFLILCALCLCLYLGYLFGVRDTNLKDKINCSILKWYIDNDRSQVEKMIILHEMFGSNTNGLFEYLSGFRSRF